MLTPDKVNHTIQTINNGSDSVLISEVRPMRKYIDKKPTDEIECIRYLCILSSNKYEQVHIRVAGATPVISKEELESKGGTVKAKVKGFEGRFYKDSKSGDYRFTASATGLEVIG